jgi:hypothetical protein
MMKDRSTDPGHCAGSGAHARSAQNGRGPAPAEAVPGPAGLLIAPGQLLALQRLAGNSVVSGLLVAQRWTNPVLSLKSNKELLDSALHEDDMEALKQVDDFSGISLNEALQLIDLANNKGDGWGRDARAQRLLWDFVGADFAVVANKDGGARWKKSVAKVGTGLTEDVAEAKKIRDQFPKDVTEIVTEILFGNRALVMAEMDHMGITADASQAGPVTPDQEAEIREMQDAAQLLARLQKAQEHARELKVGWEHTQMTDMVSGLSAPGPDQPPQQPGETVYWVPVTFDPFRPPQLLEAPTAPGANVVQITDKADYADVKKKFDTCSDYMEYLLVRYPMLYAISREGKSADTASFAAEPSPAKAREMLGAGMRQLFNDIETTQRNLGGSLDVLDLTPVHAKMTQGGLQPQGGTVGWNQPTEASIANALVADHDFSNAIKAVALSSASELLFLVAPLAGPGAIFVMLAGLAVAGVTAALSADRFEAMATAAKTSAAPGTEIVSASAVDDAGKQAEADKAALELAAIGVGMAVAGQVLGEIKGPTPDTPLTAAARAQAKALLGQAAKAEAQVTPTLQGIAAENGGTMEGLDNRLKSEDSLARKIEAWASRDPQAATDPEAACKAAAAKVNDALRYTVSVDPARYMATKNAAYARLAEQGYVLKSEWNAWDKTPATGYKGINSTFTMPEGQLFELQFHTPESFAMKSELHAMYEEWRASGTTPERRAELEAIMRDKFGTVPVPGGAAQ